jgi:hypothetical protein
LVSFWPADGSPEDIRGCNNGIPSPDLSYPTGVVDKAFFFDGVSQHVRIAASESLSNPEYSVELWVGPNGPVVDFDGQDILFGRGFGAAQLAVRPGTSGLVVYWGFVDPNLASPGTFGATEIPIGQWTHLVGTFADGQLKLYINGQLSSSASTTSVPNASGCDFYIGGLSNACGYTGQFFNGLIDEVAYFDRAISTRDIERSYARGLAGNRRPLVGPRRPCQP